MKRIVVSIFVAAFALCALPPVFAAKALVRLEGVSAEQIRQMAARGDDIAKAGPGFVEVVLDEKQQAELAKTKKAHAKLIPDLDAYVAKVVANQRRGEQYYTFETMAAQLEAWAKQYPNICRLESIGKSCEGREIWALKVSDKPELDEKEPAVLVMGAHHAREWMSFEVPMATIKGLIEGYGKDEQLTKLVDERETWFVPMVNPDGVAYTQKSKYWRKNRRKNKDGSYGVDLNRNYGYKWGNTGSSNSGNSDTYHGPNAFSEPESCAIRDLAAREKFAASVSFHSYSELILFPFGYAYNVPTPDHDLLAKLAGEMSKFNRYTPENSADLYPAMGDSDDYLYGTEKILAFTFELGQTFIPPAAEIKEMNALNVPAIFHLIDKAGTYGLVTPAGQETIPALGTRTAVAALADLSTVAMNNDQAAKALTKLQNELAARIAGEQAQGLTSTVEAVRSGARAPVVQAVLQEAAQRASFDALHNAAR